MNLVIDMIIMKLRLKSLNLIKVKDYLYMHKVVFIIQLIRSTRKPSPRDTRFVSTSEVNKQHPDLFFIRCCLDI